MKFIIEEDELKDLYLSLCNEGNIRCEDLQDKIQIILDKKPVEMVAEVPASNCENRNLVAIEFNEIGQSRKRMLRIISNNKCKIFIQEVK